MGQIAQFGVTVTPAPCMTFRRVVVSLRGPGQSPALRMLRRVAAFCQPLRPVLLLVLFPRSRSPVVGVPGLCWMWLRSSLGRILSSTPPPHATPPP